MNFVAAILFCCAFVATAVAEDRPSRGQLCFSGECRLHSCGESVEAAGSARTFIFSPSRHDHRLGVLAAGATVPSCELEGSLDVQVRLLDRGMQNVLLRMKSAEGSEWAFRLTEDDVKRPITIGVARGSYEIVAETPHFVTYRKTLEIAADRAVVVAELRPLRTIEGILVDRVTGAVVGGAKIVADTGEDAITQRDGRFVLEIDPERWPKQLDVRAKGFGSRIVAVPPARVNTSLDKIALARGVTVEAAIHQTEPGQVVLVELLKLRNQGRQPGGVVQTLTLPKSHAMSRSVRFENVEPGQYVVLANGARPSQRAGQRVDVQEWDVPPVNVQLTPFRLRLRTMKDGEPLGDTRVILRQHEAFWQTDVAMDDAGEAAVDLWQGGRVTATVESRNSVPWRNERTIAEAIDGDWLLEMPRLEVVGRVIDAESGAAIPNAGVALEMSSTERHYHLSVSANADHEGAFRFAPVFPGEHTIRVASSDYPVSETIYTFGEEEESRSLTIALHRTPRTQLSVVDARGLPVTGAKVFVLAGDAATVTSGRTDATGQTPVFIPEGATHNVLVVPRDGSLGAMRIQSGTRQVRMVLPEGSSRIVVRAESESHEPIPRISLDVRYNGFLLPVEVMEALTARGSMTASDADGRMVLNNMPAGTYELWPVPGNAGRAPVRMIATPGENLATLTYTRR